MRYLLPKQMKNNGVKDERAGGHRSRRCAASSATTRAKPACARSSARSPRSAARWSRALQLKQIDADKVVVTDDNLNDFLGVRKFDYGQAEKKNQVGQVVGLAWTEVGGDLLTIEAAVMPGKGNIIRTGSLGDVMKESVEAARSVVRSRAAPARHQGRDVREERHPHPRARRRDAEGRPERGRRDDDGVRLGADRHPGARATSR